MDRRTPSVALYSTLLILGPLAASVGIYFAIERARAASVEDGANWWRFTAWYVLSHGGVGIALLLLTLAYAIAFLRGQSGPGAPIAYLVSYLACGFVFYAVLLSIGKAGDTTDYVYALGYGIPLIVASVGFSVFGLIRTLKGYRP